MDIVTANLARQNEINTEVTTQVNTNWYTKVVWKEELQ